MLRLVLVREVAVVTVLRIEDRSEAVVEVKEARAECGHEFPGRGGGGGRRRERLPLVPLCCLGLDGGVARGFGRSGSLGGIGVAVIVVLSWLPES